MQRPCKYISINWYNIVSDEELLKKDNIYRILEDYPDFDFQIAVVTHDGWVIVINNEA